MKVFETDDEMLLVCGRLLNLYPEKFSHIDPEDLYVVRDVSSEKSRKYADTSLVQTWLFPLTAFRIMIRIYDCVFSCIDPKAQTMVMYHELEHIRPVDIDDQDKKGKYKLRQHDVEDFSEMIINYNLHWAVRTDLPDLLARTESKLWEEKKWDYKV